MDVERLEMGEKSPETRGVAPESQQPLKAESATIQQEENIASAVAERRRAVENAARTTREMKDPLLVRVESLLSEGLADEYAALSGEKKKSFREEGEVLATWLKSAIARGAVKPHQVLARIEHWLLIIEEKDRHAPWLLQDAYIRARRVLNEEMYNEKGH